MIFFDFIRASFIITSIFVIVILVLLSVYMYKKNNEYKSYIIRIICVGIPSIAAYNIFFLQGSHNLAVFFDSLFFVGTDWLALFMCIFAIGYTGILLEYKKKILISFSILCGFDTLSLFINNVTYHMFDLVLMSTKSGIVYWGNDFGFLHYVHLSLCYVMVSLTCILLVISIHKSPVVCKVKYIGILIAYIVVIIVNCICYSVNLSFDISVILYGVLAGFICYYSTYTYPHKMLIQLLKSINDTASDAMMYFDDKGKCIYANKRAKELFENNGKFEPCLAEAYKDKWKDELIEESLSFSTEDCFKISGREHHFVVEYKNDSYSNQKIGSYIKLQDITEDYVSYRKEKYIATHDTMTGVLNRNGFFDEVDKLIEEKGTFGYIMLSSNIRDFKMINEMFGEKIGDEVILKQAGILKTFSHSTTIYARICDDKYALYTKREYFNEKEFLEYMKLMQKVLDKPLYQLRLVVGVYQPQGRIESAQTMYDKALLAAAQISTKYNETYAYYDTILMEKLMNEKALIDDFEEAIDSNQIEMYLQPIVDKNGKYCGAEALSRWNHPKRGFLVPQEFIEILEKKGLIYQLDTFIWETSAKLLRKWADEGIKDHYISVNVSVKDFFYIDIYKAFTRLVEIYDIEPKNLHIEITEHVLMSDFARAYAIASKLQKAGFYVAIDDFGNGYSSLNMLMDFHASELKIGMSLIQTSVQTERSRVILQSIVEMANNLGINVISEGIESKEQYDLLDNCNCKYFQGNYLVEPKTVAEYEAMLSH